MEMHGLLDVFPVWTILPLTLAVGLIAVELGYRVARERRKRAEDEKEAPVGAMAASMLALLALILAFTFGYAASRFEDRRQVLLSESSAIGTAYLRASLLPEPMRTEERNLFREYVDVRLEAATQPGKVSQAMSKSEEIHNRLWAQAVAAAEKERTPMTSLFIQALNEVIVLHARRVMVAVRSRVPAPIWIVLFLLAFLSMAMLGYHEALTNSRRSPAVLALVLGFCSVLFLIVDLDRPGQGVLEVNQQAMIDLRKSMN
jgi:hypothetical protein